MPTVWLLSLAVFAPVITGVVTMLWPRAWHRPRVWVAAAGPALAFALVLAAGVVDHPLGGGAVAHGEHAGHADHAEHAAGHDHAAAADPGHAATAGGGGSIAWVPTLHIDLAWFPDGLAGFFALLVSGIGVLIVLYARAYFGRAPDDLYRFFPTLGFFTTAMLGLVLSDSLLLTLLFWEMTSISSFLLIGWDRFDKHAVKLGMQAFFTTGLGGMGLFGGLLIFGNETGLWRWSELMAAAAAGALEIDASLTPGNRYLWAFVLMLVGAGMKSAQFPFHYWLPGAMASPTPVSAFLHSATMVKAGVFLLGRIAPLLGLATAAGALELWPMVVVPLGAATMLYGAAVAIQQHDLKRIFAYTTVSQLGLLTCMYGLGGLEYHHAPNLDFDVTQIANHAFYKAPLFIVAGALGHVASRNLTELHGAWRRHKAMVVTMLAAGYALAALPGSISFQAKELFLDAVLHSQEAIGGWRWALMAATVLTAACNVAIFIRLATTLLGLPGSVGAAQGPATEHGHGHAFDPHDDGHAHAGHDAHDDHGGGHGHHHEHEAGLWGVMLWLPAAIIVSLQYLGGLATPLWNRAFEPFEQIASNHYIGQKFGGVPALWDIAMEPGWGLLFSAIAIGGGVLLGYSKLLRGAVVDWADRIYPAMYWLAVTGGGRAFRLVQTGYLRHYVVMVIAALLIGFVAAVTADPAMLDAAAAPFADAFEYWPGLVLAAIACVAAVAIPLTRSRIVRVLILGATGFTVVGLYIVYKAPDLALTQLMFEIISVFLFLLVLRLLPKPVKGTAGGRMWRVPVSLAVGAVFAVMTLVAAPTPDRATDASPLGAALAQNAYDAHADPEAGYVMDDSRGGGGKNVVNVILVDFRGFDTLGEITVLCLAAMGVWSMIPRRRSGGGSPGEAAPRPPAWERRAAEEPTAAEGATVG